MFIPSEMLESDSEDRSATGSTASTEIVTDDDSSDVIDPELRSKAPSHV